MYRLIFIFVLIFTLLFSYAAIAQNDTKNNTKDNFKSKNSIPLGTLTKWENTNYTVIMDKTNGKEFLIMRQRNENQIEIYGPFNKNEGTHEIYTFESSSSD